MRAAAYYRRSTDRQEQSIDDQRKAVETYADENGFEIVREYVDDGISGALAAKRESFLKMVEDSASGDFEAILVYDISRFGRMDNDETGHYRFLLSGNGVDVVYTQDDLGDGDTAEMVRPLLQQQKHMFLIHLARDVSRGQASTAEQGRFVGGRAPYGFKRALVDADGSVVQVLERGEKKTSDRHKVALVPGDAGELAVVRDIFRRFLNGLGYRAIAASLNERSIPSARGGAWSSSTIRGILLNQRYAGDAVWNRRPKGKFYGVRDGRPERKPRRARQRVERNDPSDWIVVKDAHPAIVDRAQFEAAQRRIKSTGQNDGHSVRSRVSSYPLSGLLYCACGNRLWGQSHRRRDHRGNRVEYRYYGCSGGQTGRVPGHKVVVPADQLERFIVRKVREIYEAVDIRAEVQRALRVIGAATQEDSSEEAEALRQEIARTDRALASAGRRVLLADDDETAKGIAAEAARLRRERPSLVAKLDALDTTPAPVAQDIEDAVERHLANIRNLEATYAAAPLEEKRACLEEWLATADGEIGPVVLYLERDESGKRARSRLLGGTMGVAPIAAPELLGVSWCRRGDSNPHDR